ncbi:MAG: hypothetical protein ACLTBV_00295 [Enterocloster bolteae]
MTDMTRGDSLKVIICFALPLVAAAVIQQLFSLTDAMVLGIFSGDRGAGCAGSLFMARVWFQVKAHGLISARLPCLLTAVRFGATKMKRI